MASQFKTFVAGDVLTASELNAYLMKQAVIVCDSSADYPSSPVEGMTVYDKALDSLLVYTTGTSGWNAPWNLPWGYIGSANQTSAVSGVTTTATALTGCSVSFTSLANRRYKISYYVRDEKGTAGGYNLGVIRTVGGTGGTYVGENPVQQYPSDTSAVGSGEGNTITDVPGAGAINYTLYLVEWFGGSHTITNSHIIVEDIGPSGAPA